MNTCECLNPKVIVNPASLMWLIAYRHYSVGSRIREVSDCQLSLLADGEYLPNVLSRVTPEDYIINVDTGETQPLFLYVPCRKCAACLYKNVTSYIQRGRFEAQQHDEPALFITLTYNNNHLPSDGLLCPRHVQLFKKRFNKFVFDNFGLTGLKYMCFGEYGSLRGRPHYHLLVFGFPFSKSGNHINTRMYETQRIINYCWRSTSKGFAGQSYDKYCSLRYSVFNDFNADDYSIGHVDFKPCIDNLPLSYITKYITKQCAVSSSRPLWHSCSINLGVSFASQMLPYALSSLDGSFNICENQKIKKCTFCRYFLNKLLPTYCSSVSSELRNMLDEFSSVVHALYHKRVILDYLNYDIIKERFKDIFHANLRDTLTSSVDALIARYSYLSDVLLTYPVPDVAIAVSLSEKRQLLISRMTKDYVPDVLRYVYDKQKYYNNIKISDLQ